MRIFLLTSRHCGDLPETDIFHSKRGVCDELLSYFGDEYNDCPQFEDYADGRCWTSLRAILSTYLESSDKSLEWCLSELGGFDFKIDCYDV